MTKTEQSVAAAVDRSADRGVRGLGGVHGRGIGAKRADHRPDYGAVARAAASPSYPSEGSMRGGLRTG